MILAVDLDGVVIDLMSSWLRAYNLDWHDNLELSDVTDWHVEKFVNPEAKSAIYSYLETPRVEPLYHNAQMVADAAEGIATLRQCGARVVFATANVAGGMYDTKLDWLIRNGFLPVQKSQPDYISVYDKGLVRATALIDDKPRNVEGFVERGGYGFIFEQPWNANKKVLCNGRLKGWKNLKENKVLMGLIEDLAGTADEPVAEAA